MGMHPLHLLHSSNSRARKEAEELFFWFHLVWFHLVIKHPVNQGWMDSIDNFLLMVEDGQVETLCDIKFIIAIVEA